MFKHFRSFALAITLGTTALVATAAPATARDRYYRGHRGGDDAAIAIGAGLVGLAIGAAIASDNRRDRYYDGYYERGYYPRAYYPRYRTYYQGYPVYRGYDRYDRRDRYRQDRRWHRRYGY
ncbi:MAG: hypothetical protein ABW194_06390 [Novosphingobium sp.]